MARVIDIYQAQRGLPYFAGLPAMPVDNAIARAGDEAGRALMAFGESLVVARAQEEANRGTSELKVRLAELVEKYRADPDPSTARARFESDVRGAVAQIGEGMSHPRSRRLFEVQARGYAATAAVDMVRLVASRQVDGLQASLAQLSSETLVELPSLSGPARQQRIADVIGRIRMAAPQIGLARAEEMARSFETSAAQAVIFDWARRTGPAAAYQQLAGAGPTDPEVRALWSRLAPMQQEALRNRVLAEYREQRQVAAANLTIQDQLNRRVAQAAIPDFLDAWHRAQTEPDEARRSAARAEAERLLRERLRLDPSIYDRYHGLMYGSQHGARDDVDTVLGLEALIRFDPLYLPPAVDESGRPVSPEQSNIPALIYSEARAGRLTMSTARDLLRLYDQRLGEDLARLREEIRSHFRAPALDVPNSLLDREARAAQALAAKAWTDFLKERRLNPALKPQEWWEDYRRRMLTPRMAREAIQSLGRVRSALSTADVPLEYEALRRLHDRLAAQRDSIEFHALDPRQQQQRRNQNVPVPPRPQLPPGMTVAGAVTLLRELPKLLSMTQDQFELLQELQSANEQRGGRSGP